MARKKRGVNGSVRIEKVRAMIYVPEDIISKGKARAIALRRGSFSNYVENLIADDLKEAVAA